MAALKQTIEELPIPLKNVFITYNDKVLVRDKHYDHYESAIVTRRAFYSDSDGYYDSTDKWISTPNGFFNVPQFWTTQYFNDGGSAIMPHTFYYHPRVLPEMVMKWEYDMKDEL